MLYNNCIAQHCAAISCITVAHQKPFCRIPPSLDKKWQKVGAIWTFSPEMALMILECMALLHGTVLCNKVLLNRQNKGTRGQGWQKVRSQFGVLLSSFSSNTTWESVMGSTQLSSSAESQLQKLLPDYDDDEMEFF